MSYPGTSYSWGTDLQDNLFALVVEEAQAARLALEHRAAAVVRQLLLRRQQCRSRKPQILESSTEADLTTIDKTVDYGMEEDTPNY